jgi:two-component system LytT family response regulator
MENLSALIVDDEPLARERIRALLSADPEITMIRECANGLEAIAALRDSTPHILFLDIEIPELNGFEVLEDTESNHTPAVIVVSAYGQYAVRAFEVRAVDYLLKPFDRDRFAKAVHRAKEHIRHVPVEQLSGRLLALLEDTPKKPSWGDRLALKCDGRTVIVRFDEIDWIGGSGNYVCLHVGPKSLMVRDTMNGIEAKLDPARLVRIHRSTIVNVDRIDGLESWFHGDHLVLLKDGSKLTLSRRYRDRIGSVLGWEM